MPINTENWSRCSFNAVDRCQCKLEISRSFSPLNSYVIYPDNFKYLLCKKLYLQISRESNSSSWSLIDDVSFQTEKHFFIFAAAQALLRKLKNNISLFSRSCVVSCCVFFSFNISRREIYRKVAQVSACVIIWCLRSVPGRREKMRRFFFVVSEPRIRECASDEE